MNYTFNEILKIFNPSMVLKEAARPIIENLQHPFFKKLLLYTDQVIILINQSTMEYLFVSENCKNVFGYSHEEFKDSGFKAMIEQVHPADLRVMTEEVFPSFNKCLLSLAPEDQLNLKATYNYRFRNPNKDYIQILQQNIVLTCEANKVILGMVLCSDITDYKRDTHVCFKNVLLNNGSSIELSSNLSDRRFSRREIEVLEQIANGRSEKEIAENLSVSIFTIKTHKKNMLKKAGVKNGTELVSYGLANLII